MGHKLLFVHINTSWVSKFGFTCTHHYEELQLIVVLNNICIVIRELHDGEAYEFVLFVAHTTHCFFMSIYI